MDGSDKLTCMYPLQKNTPHRNKVRRNEHLNRFQHLVGVMSSSPARSKQLSHQTQGLVHHGAFMDRLFLDLETLKQFFL